MKHPLLATLVPVGLAAMAAFSPPSHTSVAVPPSALSQDPADPPMWDLGIGKRNEVAREAIQGCWMLVEYDRPGTNDNGDTTRGYMLIANGFLSLEVHGIVGNLGDIAFQTGTHSYDMNQRGELVTSSLIGTNSPGPDDPLSFERPGRERTFRMTYGPDTLELTRVEDDVKLSFRRVKPPEIERDIFGRDPASVPGAGK